MCRYCELKDLTAAIFGQEVVKIEVGKIDPLFLEDLQKLDEAKEKLDAEREGAEAFKMDDWKEDLKKKEQDFNRLFNATWKDALASAGVCTTGELEDYRIDKQTGIVRLVRYQPVRGSHSGGVL